MKTQLYESQVYLSAITKKIAKAQKRIVIFTHIIAYDDMTSKLIEVLCAAAQRGVSVEVAGDVYTFGILGGYWPWQNDRIKKLREMRRTFRAAGVEYRWIGQFGPFLFAGRTHVKWCVIDDDVFSFGGVNLYKQGLTIADYMIGTASQSLANRLEYEHRRIARADRSGRWYRSHKFACSIGTVLIDGGRPLDSLIYRRACALAEKATEITFVSQYCPTGPLGRILREKNAAIYFNPWSMATGANRFLIRMSTARTGYPTDYKRKIYNHAKCIIFTMPDGSKTALTGSHNFVYGGVVLGTREIALETTDTAVIKQLESFIKKHIA